MVVLAVALAGALGALARWGISVLMVRWLGTALPWGTFAVNLTGCFLLGLLAGVTGHLTWITHEVRLVIAVGFIGTLTTFSTFEWDTLQLANGGALVWAGINLVGNVALGLLLIWAGNRLGAAAWA